MNIDKYPEIHPGSKRFKKAYAFVMLLTVGRGIEAASRVDEAVKTIVGDLPEGFTFSLGVAPSGPWMIMEKDASGRLRYLGWRRFKKKTDLDMIIRNIEAAFRLFTFRESTAQAYNYGRFSVNGNLPNALSVMRIMDIVEIYLLPKIIAALAVKRYPDSKELPPARKHFNRLRIYLSAFSPGLVRVVYRNL